MSELIRIEGWDLVVDGDEPRVRDIDIAERAGLPRARDIRPLIVRNMEELEAHGRIDMRGHKSRISKPNGGHELREVTEYYLNEAQAVALVSLMRTPQAVELRIALVKLFVAYRRGQLVGPVSPLRLDIVHGPRIGEQILLRREARERCEIAARATKRSLQAIQGSLRREFLVSSIYQIPVQTWPWALRHLDGLALGRILLPVRGRVLRLMSHDPRQTTLPFTGA